MSGSQVTPHAKLAVTNQAMHEPVADFAVENTQSLRQKWGCSAGKYLLSTLAISSNCTSEVQGHSCSPDLAILNVAKAINQVLLHLHEDLHYERTKI